MKEKKQSPKVISFKKYQDEIGLMETQNKTLVTSLQNEIDTYKIEIKAKIGIITRLHDELANSKAQFNTLSDVVNNLDKEINRLRNNQKKWYHFF